MDAKTRAQLMEYDTWRSLILDRDPHQRVEFSPDPRPRKRRHALTEMRVSGIVRCECGAFHEESREGLTRLLRLARAHRRTCKRTIRLDQFVVQIWPGE